jgi:hypothetical protein
VKGSFKTFSVLLEVDLSSVFCSLSRSESLSVLGVLFTFGVSCAIVVVTTSVFFTSGGDETGAPFSVGLAG